MQNYSPSPDAIYGVNAMLPSSVSPTSPAMRLYNLTAYIYNVHPERVMHLLDKYNVGATPYDEENVRRCNALVKTNKEALVDLVKAHPDRALFDPEKHKEGCGCSTCKGKNKKKKFWEKSWITPALLLIVIILSILNLIKQ